MNIFQSLLFNLIFFYLLIFAGSSMFILGFVVNESFLTTFGGLFSLITIFVFRKSIPLKMLIWALVGAFMGTGVGAASGWLVGNTWDLTVGVVGGAIFGAITGIVVLAALNHGSLKYLPIIVTRTLFAIALIGGAIGGVIGLREIFPKIFGATGGLAVVGWNFGMIVGALAAASVLNLNEKVSNKENIYKP